MNLNHLEIFQAVAEAGSVTRGAERLMISQPAVSKQIRLLERSLRIELFRRNVKPLVLTDAGHALASYARRIFGLAREAEQAIEDLQHLRQGRLAIAASATIGVYLLPDVLVRFRRKFPGVRLQFEIENGQVLRRRLEDEAIDIGLSEVPLDSPILEVSEFMRDEFVAIAAPDHPFARRRSLRLAEFCKQPFIVREAGSNTQSLVERSLASRGISIQRAIALGSTEAIKCAVAARLGVAIVPRMSLGLEISAGRLTPARVADLKIDRPLYQYQLRGRAQSKAMIAFLCLLKHAARGTLSKLKG